jgi:tungstate transport system ATP-binding protein
MINPIETIKSASNLQPSTSNAVLFARNLRVVRAGVTILDIPELTVQTGEVLSLIGPNGAGKTTLLQTLCCLLKPFEGEVIFNGMIVGKDYVVHEYRQKIAMVFQEPLLFDTTVSKNVASGLKFRYVCRKDIERRVTENLERFGISHLRDRSSRTLSGGEAQRTSLARAFATRPEILFLDEPFASLDPPTRESLVEDLERVLKESGTSAFFATHDRMEALRLSDRIAVMNTGRIHQIGQPEEVMNHPVDTFVASFVGVETILNGKVGRIGDGTFTASVLGKEIEAVGDVYMDEPVLLCIRPEDVTLSRYADGRQTSARNVFDGRIERIVPLGVYTKVEINCGFPLVAFITKNSVENLQLSEGGDVTASFKATAIHVVKR